jgi:predicted DNA-binding protein
MKTKVVAFRVTQEAYDALAFMSKKRLMKVSYYVNDALLETISHAINEYRKEQKRLQAKAKRDAKKAANAVQ